MLSKKGKILNLVEYEKEYGNDIKFKNNCNSYRLMLEYIKNWAKLHTPIMKYYEDHVIFHGKLRYEAYLAKKKQIHYLSRKIKIAFNRPIKDIIFNLGI